MSFGGSRPMHPDYYGAAGGFGNDIEMAKARRKVRAESKSNLGNALAALFLPWLLFVVTLATESWVKYGSPAMGQSVTLLGAAFVLATGYLVISAWRNGSDPFWNSFMCLTGLLTVMLATWAGEYNFTRNTQPYYDVLNLNIYPSVDPSTTRGNQVMDGGQFSFTSNAYVDTSKSMSFKNVDSYCVAPITSGGNATVYDFWAVGLNCCSGIATNYHCGELSNPRAHAGLRVMRDDLRPFFQLAAQQAAATYNITLQHPIFVNWMQDPKIEINAYQDAGTKFFLMASFGYLAWQLFCVTAGVFLASKM